MSWGARVIDYFGLISFAEIAGLIGFIYSFCHLGDEGCKSVKERIAAFLTVDCIDFGWMYPLVVCSLCIELGPSMSNWAIQMAEHWKQREDIVHAFGLILYTDSHPHLKKYWVTTITGRR